MGPRTRAIRRTLTAVFAALRLAALPASVAATAAMPTPLAAATQAPAARAPAAARAAVTLPAGDFAWHVATVTAYTAGPESTGKRPGEPGYGVTYSGLPVRPGVAAVDPKVIPLGSVLFVPGYGLAVALDTGSAVRGWHVDVFTPALGKALAWGRQTLWVGVLRQSDNGERGQGRATGA